MNDTPDTPIPPTSDTNASETIRTVLIVEDTIELAEIIQATLQQIGLRVFHEAHGTRAIERYFEVSPDVVLLDLALPDTSGWKVLDAIREREWDGTRPHIIVITAYGDPANRLMGKLQDVHGYLIKPFMPDDVEREVRKVLAQLS